MIVAGFLSFIQPFHRIPSKGGVSRNPFIFVVAKAAMLSQWVNELGEILIEFFPRYMVWDEWVAGWWLLGARQGCEAFLHSHSGGDTWWLDISSEVNSATYFACLASSLVPYRFKTLTILIITYCEVRPTLRSPVVPHGIQESSMGTNVVVQKRIKKDKVKKRGTRARKKRSEEDIEVSKLKIV